MFCNELEVMLLWVQWRINPALMLPMLSTSSPCFGFRLHFDLIALSVHFTFGLGLGAWDGVLGRRKGWVGVGQASWVCDGVCQQCGSGGDDVRGLKVERESWELWEFWKEKKKKGQNNILIRGRINFFFFLAFNYSAH